MTPEPICFTAAVTPKGYRGVLLHLSALRLRLIVPLIAFVAFGALGAGFNNQAYLMLGVLLAVLVTVWGYIAWNTGAPANAELYLPVAYELGPEGIVYAGEAGRGTIEWERVRRWRYASGHYLLYVAGASYLMLPEADVSGADSGRLEALLREQVRKGPKRVFR